MGLNLVVLVTILSLPDIFMYNNAIKNGVKDTTYAVSVYPSNDTINSSEVDTIYARLLHSGAPVSGESVEFRLISGSGYFTWNAFNTDPSGLSYTVFRPSHADIDTISAFYADTTGDTASDTTIVHVTASYIDTLTLFGDSLFFYPSPLGHGIHTANIEYYIPANVSETDIEILDPFGNLVYKRIANQGNTGCISSSWNRITWDGTNGHGKRVSSGMYILVVRAFRYSKQVVDLKKRIGVEW